MMDEESEGYGQTEVKSDLKWNYLHLSSLASISGAGLGKSCYSRVEDIRIVSGMSGPQ
jgi:hypothetical protein